MSCGSSSDLAWLKDRLEETFGISTQLIGIESQAANEVKILNRVVRAVPEGFELEADPRNGEFIIEALQSNTNSATPGLWWQGLFI